MATSKKSVKFMEISDDHAGQRIDNFLLKHLKNVPKSHIYQLLRSGQVRVNSGRKKPAYRLEAGDKVRVPPIRLEQKENVLVPAAVIKLLEQSVLYEDKNLLVINKPSGIAVHGGSGLRFGIIEAFRQILPETPVELIHRLDRETSGCLLMTKNRTSMTAVQQLFQQDPFDKSQNQVSKTYLSLLSGQWQHGNLTIDAPLSKISVGGEHRMAVNTEGQTAVTHFEPVEIFKHFSLMRIKIETGRMHQIRVHAQYCGHAVAGDTRYGSKEINKKLREPGLKRLFLHASDLYLPLPDKNYHFHAPLTEELSHFLQQLRSEC